MQPIGKNHLSVRLFNKIKDKKVSFKLQKKLQKQKQADFLLHFE